MKTSEHITTNIETMKGVMDAMSVGTVLGWLLGYLPAIATILTIIWTGLRLYETWLSIREKRRAWDTIQNTTDNTTKLTK